MLCETKKEKTIDMFVIGFNRSAVSRLVAQCREAGHSCQYDPFQSSMKSQFRQANKLNAERVFILGEEELTTNQVTIKHMRTSDQIKIGLDRVDDFLDKIGSGERREPAPTPD
jgi:histidyl-tRNA synthetase